MLARLLCVVLLLAVAARAADDVEGQFRDFMQKYNRSYPNFAEYYQRLQVFGANMEIAKQLNASNPHAWFGVNQFSDMSREEFRARYLMSNFTRGTVPAAKISQDVIDKFKNGLLPTSYDWRNRGVVTGVYNQGSCGSCWAFSATENIESMWALAGGGLENLSMQQLVDCDGGSHGCGGGDPVTAYETIMQEGGQDSYGAYPYQGSQGPCRFNSGAVAARIGSYVGISSNDNENEMGAWTYQYGPPSACVDASTWQSYGGGVITSCPQQIDHCIQITGWDTVDGIPAWTVRNSWGTGWGYGGYLYVARGANVCAIGDYVTSSTI